MTTAANHLLTDQELAEAGPPEAVRLPLDLVDPSPNNPRGQLPEVDALADNIKEFGLLQPVTVRRTGERYELIGGHRRWSAFLALRERFPEDIVWRTIPAVVRRAEDDDRDYLRLISAQVHNRAWRPREEAAALERLMLGGRTLLQVGAALNRSEAWASKRLRVYADSVLSGYVQSGRLSTGVAEELLLIRDLDTRREYAQRAADEKWGQDKARAETRMLRLDRQMRELAKRTRELLNVLSQVDPSCIPPSATKDLWTLQGRIVAIGRGGPVLPTIAEAQRAAGVREQVKPQRGKRRPGYKPKTNFNRGSEA